MDGVGVPGVATREYAIDGVGVPGVADRLASEALNDAPVTSSLNLTPGVPGVPGVHRTPGVPGVRPGV